VSDWNLVLAPFLSGLFNCIYCQSKIEFPSQSISNTGQRAFWQYWVIKFNHPPSGWPVTWNYET
jgi:hypothetical protein